VAAWAGATGQQTGDLQQMCERFASAHLFEGERIVDDAPTYRGAGQCFL
jgi:hypothetical protein